MHEEVERHDIDLAHSSKRLAVEPLFEMEELGAVPAWASLGVKRRWGGAV